MTSPTQRTLAWLREHKWVYSTCSGFNSFTKTRWDCWGFADYVALDPSGQIHWIQITSDAHHAERRRKIEKIESAKRLSRSSAVEVWTWGLKGPQGTRKTWTLRVERGIHLTTKGYWVWTEMAY